MSAIACDLSAIGTADRARYDNLATRIRGSVRDRIEIANGYILQINDSGVSADEIAEWIGFESLCCPFLSIQHSGPSLMLTGPPGIKKLIEMEFPSVS